MNAQAASPATIEADGRTSGGAGQVIAIVAVVGAILLGTWAVLTADPDLDTSTIGLRGLALHLKGESGEGREVRVIERPIPKPDRIGLRILPVFDPRPSGARNRPDADGDGREILRPLRPTVLSGKVREARTLVVMHKWRMGAARQRTFHPGFLVDAERMSLPVAGRLADRRKAGSVAQAPAGIETARTAGRLRSEVTLFAAQTLNLSRGGLCEPFIWLGPDRYARTLVATCRLDRGRRRGGAGAGAGENTIRAERSGESAFYLVSDPDLLNNHGLALGENAAFATALVDAVAGDGPVLLDETPLSSFIREVRRDRRGRSFSDLARFFEWPFSLVWAALGALAALALWRAALRFGPIIETRDRFHAASKTAMIDTNARILAAGGASPAMLREHARYRLAGLARELFGAREAGRAVLMRTLARRNPDLARRIEGLVDEADSGVGGNAAQPARWIAAFDSAIGDVEREFGRRA